MFLSVTSLTSRYGGPAYSVGRLAAALADAGVEVGLWTPDGSAIDAGLEIVPFVPSNPVRKLQGGLDDAIAAFGTPNVLHDNGIWMPHNHRIARISAKRGIPRVVSTRGMLEPWAMAHKGWKKSIAWRMYQRRDLDRAALLHATSDVEKNNLETYSLRSEVSVIPNGVDIPELPAVDGRGSEGSEKTALFIGRLYPVKGLPTLIKAWSHVVPDGWKLVIAGPDEAGHLATLKRLVAATGLERVISFVGPVEGSAKRTLYRAANLFILPTRSESFGMAIAESLSYGVPVLTTTAAPWPWLDGTSGGWRVPPEMEGIAGGLALVTSLDSSALAAVGQRGRDLVIERFGWKNVGRLLTAEYARLVRQGAQWR